MEELSLHILDIAENSITAGAKNIEIKVEENKKDDLLRIEIIDDGKGMDEETVKKALDPFFTSRTTRRVGLGLSLLNDAAKRANGNMEIRSMPDKGTYVCATFQLSHVDRQPLGNMTETITSIIAMNPAIDVRYVFKHDDYQFVFNSKEIKEEFEKSKRSTAEMLLFAKKYLTENTKSFS